MHTRTNGYSLLHASEALKNDKEFVLAAVQQSGRGLQLASEALKNDKEVVLAAVGQNGMSLQHAAAALKNDKEVVLAAVRQDGDSFDSLRFAGEALEDLPPTSFPLLFIGGRKQGPTASSSGHDQPEALTFYLFIRDDDGTIFLD